MYRSLPFKAQLAEVKVDANSAQDNRACNRLKNIKLTKLHASYERYLKTVPREFRIRKLCNSWHPITPDHTSKTTISQWNRKISAWRKKVYLWNNITDAQCAQLSEAVKRGDVDAFLNICTRKAGATSTDDGYNRLLDPTCKSNLITPLLYKPAWFNGHISHAGFHTIEEKQFVQRAGALYRNAGSHFKTFYQDYLQSYTHKKSDFSEY